MKFKHISILTRVISITVLLAGGATIVSPALAEKIEPTDQPTIAPSAVTDSQATVPGSIVVFDGPGGP